MKRRRSNTNYREELTVPELVSKFRPVIYDVVMEAVTETLETQGIEAFKQQEPKSFDLVNFEVNDERFAIQINRLAVLGFIKRAVEYFEYTEQYQKCAICQRMMVLFQRNGL